MMRILLLCVAAECLMAQGKFTRLGAPAALPTDISGDGKIVVGARSNLGPLFRWTEEEGVVNIGGTGFQAAISRDGKVIVAEARDARGIESAAIWQGGTNWRTLGGFPGGGTSDGQSSSPWSVSGDGSVIVGLAWVNAGTAHAFRWDVVNGMVDLGSLQEQSSRASVVSDDGNVVGGWDDDPRAYTHHSWRGSIWWQGLQRLMHPNGWTGEVIAMNNVGSIIVGKGHPANTRHAYRYTAWNGQVEDLGAIPRGLTDQRREEEDTSSATGVSDDGKVVVGISGWRPPRDAFVWTPETKMVRLAEYLASRGVTGFEGWQFLDCVGITPDGKTILGTAINPAGLVEGFVATTP